MSKYQDSSERAEEALRKSDDKELARYKLRLESLRDRWEHSFKGINAFLVAHAAVIATAVSTLKDCATVPQLKGIG